MSRAHLERRAAKGDGSGFDRFFVITDSLLVAVAHAASRTMAPAANASVEHHHSGTLGAGADM